MYYRSVAVTKKRTSLEAVVPLLVSSGFRKRAGALFTLDLVPGVLGWLGLNRATEHYAAGEMEFHPVVGVRFQEVERLVAECRGEKFHSYVPPTISRPVRYLVPENRRRRWVFSPGHSEEVASDMTDAIVTYGIEFMRSVIDLADLRLQLEDADHEHQRVYRRPAAALVAGDVEGARALLDEGVAALGTRMDRAAVDFRKFAEVLRNRPP